METDRPRTQHYDDKYSNEYRIGTNTRAEQNFPLRYPDRSLPERWKIWFDMIDR